MIVVCHTVTFQTEGIVMMGSAQKVCWWLMDYMEHTLNDRNVSTQKKFPSMLNFFRKIKNKMKIWPPLKNINLILKNKK